jgi:hypothetical protein
MAVYLPEHLEEETIERMSPGDKGYTVPWAMFADENGRLWINGSYTVHSESGGTAAMLVERTKSGVICDIRKCRDHRWSRGAAFVGKFMPISVEKLSQ